MAPNAIVIPIAERYRKLKEILLEYVDVVAAIKHQDPNFAQQQGLFFLFLTYPWLADVESMTSDQKDFLKRREIEVKALGFDGELAKERLEEIRENDKHLAECCPTPLLLAHYLDAYFITGVADAKRRGTSKERLDFAFDEFESMTYHQGRFKRISLSHLANFEMRENSLVIQGDIKTLNDIRVERLDASTIPSILGEKGFQAFLHPQGIGNCFVVEEEGASIPDDFHWLVTKRQKALYFAQVLQYFQDGVVHIGYTVPVFMPHWADEIRRSGLFYLGDARKLPYENGTKLYRIVDNTEEERLRQWWKAATTPRTLDYLANTKGKLRQAIYRAGEYYESSHKRPDSVGRLLDLAIAVESLFSPSDKGELKFRISQSAAQLIGTTPEERQHVFESMTEMYDRRSKLVHGSYKVEDYDGGRFVTAEEIDRWACFVRRALLAFMTVYFKGDKQAPRDEILNRIAEANFGDSKGDKLRSDADLNTLFAD